MLAFIIVACNLNVSAATIPTKDTPGCREVVEDLTYSSIAIGDSMVSDMNSFQEYVPMNAFNCMQNAMPMLVKFAESHPGWQPRRWVCKHIVEEKST